MELSLTGISASVLEITWRKPNVTNGDILFYTVTVETHSGYMFQEIVPSSQTTVLISSLCKITFTYSESEFIIILPDIADKFIPYYVSVKASTSAGFGPLVSSVTFTQEGGNLVMINSYLLFSFIAEWRVPFSPSQHGWQPAHPHCPLTFYNAWVISDCHDSTHIYTSIYSFVDLVF